MHRVFTITSDEVTESSSLAVSTVHPGLVYTTNDSGDSATVYVLDATDGSLVGRTSLAGVDAIDVEAISAGSDGSLVVADIGDNDRARDSVRIYRLDQPGAGDQTVSVDAVTLAYPDGPRDAEAVVYDAGPGRVCVVSKEIGAAIYRSPPDVFGRGRAVLSPVASAPPVATDATFLPGDRLAVIRTYVGATIYRYPSWTPVRGFRLPHQEQGESVAAAPGGHEVWVGGEGVRSTVLAVRLPPIPKSEQPSPTPTPGSDKTSGPTPGGDKGGLWLRDDNPDQVIGVSEAVWLGAGVGLVVAILGLVLARRHRS